MFHLRKSMMVVGLTCILLNNLNASLMDDGIPEAKKHKYAKIHLWTEGYDVDRISLETGTGKSYVSVRADLQSPDTQIVKLQNGSRVCLTGPAVRVLSYQEDCKIEGRDADQTYIIKLKSRKTDEAWSKFVERLQGKNDLKWSLSCEPYFDTIWEDQNLQVSDTSCVLYALGYGKMDINKFLKAPKNKAQGGLINNAYALYAYGYNYKYPDDPQGKVSYLEAWGLLSAITPRDLGDFLKAEIKERIRKQIDLDIKSQKLVITRPDLKGKRVSYSELDQMLKMIDSQFPLIDNEATGFVDCLKNFGTLTKTEEKYELFWNPEVTQHQEPQHCIVQ